MHLILLQCLGQFLGHVLRLDLNHPSLQSIPCLIRSRQLDILLVRLVVQIWQHRSVDGDVASWLGSKQQAHGTCLFVLQDAQRAHALGRPWTLRLRLVFSAFALLSVRHELQNLGTDIMQDILVCFGSFRQINLLVLLNIFVGAVRGCCFTSRWLWSSVGWGGSQAGVSAKIEGGVYSRRFSGAIFRLAKVDLLVPVVEDPPAGGCRLLPNEGANGVGWFPPNKLPFP